MAQDYAALIQAMMQSPEVVELMKRTGKRSAEAEAGAKSEAQRRGLVSGTGTSDIEMALRRSAKAPIEEAGALGVAGIVGRGAEAERGRQYGTSEREASQLWGTGEREASQDWQTGERKGGQDWRTGERREGEVYGAGEREKERGWETGERGLQRGWQTGESALDRSSAERAATTQWNRQQKQGKRDWWKGFFH